MQVSLLERYRAYAKRNDITRREKNMNNLRKEKTRRWKTKSNIRKERKTMNNIRKEREQ